MNGFIYRAGRRSFLAVAAVIVAGCGTTNGWRTEYPAAAQQAPAAPPPFTDAVGAPPATTVTLSPASGPAGLVGGPTGLLGDCSSDCGSGCASHCGKCSDCNKQTLHGKLHDCDWEQLRTDHCWPEQYNFEARRRVNAPFHDQIVAGNIVECSIFEYHFDGKSENKTDLSEAGKIRLRYLARKKPYLVKAVFLQTSLDASTDAGRQKSIREYLAKCTAEAGDWQITMIDGEPVGIMGQEGASAYNKMIGAQPGQPVTVPFYERVLKNTFYQGSGGGMNVSIGGS
jgi:hypothetical protein